jgi:hypothetical protein
MIELEDFEAIFGSYAEPSPEIKFDAKGNMKKPSTTIKRTMTASQVSELFTQKVLGKMTVPTHTGVRGSRKQRKTGSAPVSVADATLIYSKGTSTLKAKFNVLLRRSKLGSNLRN